MDRMNRVPSLVRRLSSAWNRFRGLFPLPAAPPGLFLDDVGVIWGAYLFGLRVWNNGYSLNPNALTADGRLVHVDAHPYEADFCPRDIRCHSLSVDRQSDHLVVLLVSKDGGVELVYNGPTDLVHRAGRRRCRTDYRQTTIGKLRELMRTVRKSRQLPFVRPLPKQTAQRYPAPSVIEDVPVLLGEIRTAVRGLNSLFVRQRFQPILLWPGGTEEACAAYLYGITPSGDSPYGVPNAKTADGATVNVVGYVKEIDRAFIPPTADYLLVLGLNRNGEPEEIYNGPNALAWASARKTGDDDVDGRPSPIEYRGITIAKLKMLMARIPTGQRLPMLRHWPKKSRLRHGNAAPSLEEGTL